eukprot:gene1101-2143_t
MKIELLKITPFVSSIDHARCILLVSGLLCLLPVVIGLPLYPPVESDSALALSFESLYYAYALSASIAVSVPMIIDYAMDVISGNNESLSLGFVSHRDLILTLLLPDGILLGIILPTKNYEFFPCLLNVRELFLLYAFLNHMKLNFPQVWNCNASTPLAFSFTAWKLFSVYTAFTGDLNSSTITTVTFSLQLLALSSNDVNTGNGDGDGGGGGDMEEEDEVVKAVVGHDTIPLFVSNSLLTMTHGTPEYINSSCTTTVERVDHQQQQQQLQQQQRLHHMNGINNRDSNCCEEDNKPLRSFTRSIFDVIQLGRVSVSVAVIRALPLRAFLQRYTYPRHPRLMHALKGETHTRKRLCSQLQLQFSYRSLVSLINALPSASMPAEQLKMDVRNAKKGARKRQRAEKTLVIITCCREMLSPSSSSHSSSHLQSPPSPSDSDCNPWRPRGNRSRSRSFEYLVAAVPVFVPVQRIATSTLLVITTSSRKATSSIDAAMLTAHKTVGCRHQTYEERFVVSFGFALRDKGSAQTLLANYIQPFYLCKVVL